MKRAGYRDAINWIAFNDDVTQIKEQMAGGHPGEIPVLVSEALVSDIFDVSREKVRSDIKKEITKGESK